MTSTLMPTNSPKASTSKADRVFHPLSSTAELVPGHSVCLLSPSRLGDHRTVEPLAEPIGDVAGIEQPNPIGNRRWNPCKHAIGGM